MPLDRHGVNRLRWLEAIMNRVAPALHTRLGLTAAPIRSCSPVFSSLRQQGSHHSRLHLRGSGQVVDVDDMFAWPS